MQKQVTKKQQNGTVSVATAAAWSQGQEQLSSKDVVIPRIQVMQAVSEKVKEGEAKYGEIRDSVTFELLGGFDKPLKFTPFHLQRVWVVNEVSGKNRTYVETVPVESDPSNPKFNDDWKFKEEINPLTTIERTRVMNFYVLLEGRNLPHLLAFKGAGSRAGKQLATQMYMLNKEKALSPAAYQMLLVPKKQSGKSGEFVGVEVKVGRGSTQEEVEKAYGWYQRIAGGGSDLKAHEVEGAEVVEPTEF